MAGTGGDCQDGGQNAHVPRPTSVTLLLVGKIGNGKSATGNSILGREVFASRRSFRSVTLACQKESTTLEDGRIVNVIDTPGLLDTGGATKDVGKEIVDYMGMVKDGIDAVLVVFSAVSRFSEEDATTIKSVHKSFGERMILTFTHGDEVGEDEFKDMLKDAPEYMMEMVRLCGRSRVVLFDNRTKDTLIQTGQRKQLLDNVDSVVIDHKGRPFSEQMRHNIKEEEAGNVKMEEGEGQVEVEEERIEVLKPWYIQTYDFCAYAAEQVRIKICHLWRKAVAIVKGWFKTNKKDCEIKIVSACYVVQRKWLTPRRMTNYYR